MNFEFLKTLFRVFDISFRSEPKLKRETEKLNQI